MPKVWTGSGNVLNTTRVLFPVTFLNDQLQVVGVFAEVSVNSTSNGAVPLVALGVKLATGGRISAETLMNVSCVEIPCPALLDASKTME
jgi:hypothetical protein